MKRIISVLAVAALMAMFVLTMLVPAFAQAKNSSNVEIQRVLQTCLGSYVIRRLSLRVATLITQSISHLPSAQTEGL